jgi:hypothetical protein
LQQLSLQRLERAAATLWDVDGTTRTVKVD